MIEWNDWSNFYKYSKKIVENNGKGNFSYTVIEELNFLTCFIYDYLFEQFVIEYLNDDKLVYKYPLKDLSIEAYHKFEKGEYINSFKKFINTFYVKPVIQILIQKPYLSGQYLDVILRYKRNVKKALQQKNISQHTMQYVYVLIDELESILEEVKSFVKLLPDQTYFKEILSIKFYYKLSEKYTPSKVDSIIATLGRTREFGGRIIDNQADYFRFCSLIGLIDFFSEEGYLEAEVAYFLHKISAFENPSAKKNFRDYYKFKDIKSSSKYILKPDSFDFAENILSRLK